MFTPEQIQWLRDHLSICVRSKGDRYYTKYTIELSLEDEIISSTSFSIDEDG